LKSIVRLAANFGMLASFRINVYGRRFAP
jgi:hypothetical protein